MSFAEILSKALLDNSGYFGDSIDMDIAKDMNMDIAIDIDIDQGLAVLCLGCRRK